ncbi:hypothetical protein GCM10025768_15480 [Microbacterium pseudoresistens]|uniref:Uncharacterized protein n=1 Tax=Microbacterium pseudoresistens TaxID=640634 RepID=A0A7Y9ESF4_9MICO|nr:hypothetical protein [Microbacterium pseudoresistens]NYD53099.1 hypothetical protein [Microbacterium pseudoresistens]
MSRRARTALIAVGAMILLGAVAGIWWMLRPAPGPAETALGCFEALARADAQGVRSCGADVDEQQAAALAAADATVSDPVAVAEEVDGDRARVTVSYTLDGDAHRTTVELRRGSAGWSPSTSLAGTVSVTRPWGAVSVAGIDASVPIALLPGVYEASAAPAPYMTGSVGIAVHPGETTKAELAPELTDESTTAAQAQLESYLGECTAEAAEIRPHCGIRIPWGADAASLTSVAYRVEAMPQIVLTPESASFAATGGVLIATVHGLDANGAEVQSTYRTDAWSVYGDVVFTVEALRIAVR